MLMRATVDRPVYAVNYAAKLDRSNVLAAIGLSRDAGNWHLPKCGLRITTGQGVLEWYYDLHQPPQKGSESPAAQKGLAVLPQFEDFKTEDIEDKHLCFWYKHECHLIRHPKTGKWHIDVVEKKPFMPNPPEAEDLGWMLWGKDEEWGDREFDSPDDAIKFLQSGAIPY